MPRVSGRGVGRGQEPKRGSFRAESNAYLFFRLSKERYSAGLSAKDSHADLVHSRHPTVRLIYLPQFSKNPYDQLAFVKVRKHGARQGN